jgi:hypothetical protein
MGEQDATVEVRRSSQAGDGHHRLGFGGYEEPFWLSYLILHHAEVQGLHPVAAIGRITQLQQANEVLLEHLTVWRTDQHAPVDEPRPHPEDLLNGRQIGTIPRPGADDRQSCRRGANEPNHRRLELLESTDDVSRVDEALVGVHQVRGGRPLS